MKYKKTISKPKKTLSKVKKKYEKPLLKNKKILDILVKECLSKNKKDSDNFIDKEQIIPEKIQELKISKISCDDFIDKKTPKKTITKQLKIDKKTPKEIITNQLKIPQTNIFEVFVVCFGTLYNKVFINE
jgi:hypothetical protein